MLNHSDIVRRAGTPEEVALRFGISVHTVRSWIQRNRIPSDRWFDFIDAGLATRDDLHGQDQAA